MRTTPKALSIVVMALLAQCGWAEQASPAGQEPSSPRVEELSRRPERQLEDTTRAVERMKADPIAQDLLRRAKGVFVLPKFAGKAMTLNDRGAGAILLVRDGKKWSAPVFYTFGPLQLGPHAGAGLNSLAALLISDAAIDKFLGGERFSLSTDDGFNMSDHDRWSDGRPDRGDDVVMWSDAAGIFPGAAVRIDAIRPDERANRSYFGRTASPEELVDLDTKGHPQAEKLRKALAE